jgi:hypothetical protein
MAPEQLRGEPGDARSDQFSFCVALFEAVSGARPPSRADAAALALALRRSEHIRSRRQVRALVRGLAFEPEARYPSMNALLGDLEIAPRRRAQLLFAAGGFAFLAGVVLVIQHEVQPVDRVCRIESRRIGALWDGNSRLVARQVLGSSVYPSVDVGLERYLRDWVTTRVGVCEDAGTADPRLRARFDRRMRCLDGKLGAARLVIEQVSRPAKPGAADPLRAVSSLERPEACVAEPF